MSVEQSCLGIQGNDYQENDRQDSPSFFSGKGCICIQGRRSEPACLHPTSTLHPMDLLPPPPITRSGSTITPKVFHSPPAPPPKPRGPVPRRPPPPAGRFASDDARPESPGRCIRPTPSFLSSPDAPPRPSRKMPPHPHVAADVSRGFWKTSCATVRSGMRLRFLCFGYVLALVWHHRVCFRLVIVVFFRRPGFSYGVSCRSVCLSIHVF